MKKLLMIVFATLVINSVMAQTTQTLISGSVVDESNKPVVAATVYLMNATDSTLLKISVSDSLGRFSFENFNVGTYYISVLAMNYEKYASAVFALNALNPVKNVDAIVLQSALTSLATVTVTTKKPLIEQKIDRMIVNVDASVTNVGLTALEVLQKSPGIAVDKDGNISLKGKSEVLVMIDDKPSYLSNAELSNLLSSMNSNQLSQIEIMTNPSAKYDAAGNAGVINIKTKKSSTQGFNGSVTLSYGQGAYAKLNNSVMLNYRTADFNAFVNYNYMLNNGFVDVDVARDFLNADGSKSYELNQATNSINKSQNNNLKFGLDYFINQKTTIGFVASGFVAPRNQTSFTAATITNANDVISSIENTSKTSDNTWKNGALNLNFRTAFDNSKLLTANIDYLHYSFAGNQNVNGLTYGADNVLQTMYALNNVLPLNIDVYAGKLDYSQTLSSGLKIETGIKSSVVKTNNTSLFYTVENAEQKFQNAISSAFSYSENINAAYMNLNKTFGAFTLQAGLRAENTNYNGVQSSYINNKDSSFKRNYTGLFPTAFVAYQLNDNNQFAISAGRRIDRPAYQQLNPFISYVDRYMRMSGNPYLQPQISNTVELSHTYKNTFTTTLNYSVIHNMINETMTQNDSLITRSIGNIGTRYNFGISESATIPFTQWYTGIFFANLYNNKYDGLVNGYPLDASQLTLELNINNQFSFNNGWAAELSGTYALKNRDEGQAISLPLGQVSAGLSKQLLNNKASIKLNVRDVFYTQKINEIQNFQNVQSTLNITRDTRVFNLAFVWRFGVQAKPKTSEQTDEQKRIQLN